ncbi:hypothetical protein AOLI_G00310320 [Acnodon oligacanthus]
MVRKIRAAGHGRRSSRTKEGKSRSPTKVCEVCEGRCDISRFPFPPFLQCGEKRGELHFRPKDGKKRAAAPLKAPEAAVDGAFRPPSPPAPPPPPPPACECCKNPPENGERSLQRAQTTRSNRTTAAGGEREGVGVDLARDATAARALLMRRQAGPRGRRQSSEEREERNKANFLSGSHSVLALGVMAFEGFDAAPAYITPTSY